MDCDSAREAVSAGIDGEDHGGPDPALETHLATCGACREWQQRAHAVTRRARLGGAFLDHDLAPRVLAAVPVPEAWWRRRSTQRGALLAVAAAQLMIAVPLLILGHDREAGVHAAHEIGSFDFALAAAFVIGALRPKLSAGLVWPCAFAAAGLAGTAIADLCSGQTIGVDEAQHLVAVAGAALLAWQARTPERATAQPAVTVPAAVSGAWPAAVPALAELPPEPPGGHAARLANGNAAAVADDRPAATAPLARGAGGRGESVA